MVVTITGLGLGTGPAARPPSAVQRGCGRASGRMCSDNGGMAATEDWVARANAHWGPRFVANGTDHADVQATLTRIKDWDDWCREWGATARRYESIAETAARDGHPVTAGEAWRRA